MSYDLVGLGEILIDFAPQGTNEMGYPKLSAYPGGAPLNFLATAARYGCKTAYMGRVGKDAFGAQLLETVASYGIATEGLEALDEAFTTLAFVHLDADGDRSFSFARKPGADTLLCFGEKEKALVKAARCLHFGSLSMTAEPSRSATFEALAYAKAQGLLRSFDPNWRPALWDSADEARALMKEGLKNADIVKMGADELAFIYPEISSEPERIKEVFKEEIKLLLLTRGAKGCTVYTDAFFFDQEGLQGLMVKDTTGAGDIFGGAVMAQILKEESLEEALDLRKLTRIVRRATIAAGLSTEHHGGLSSIVSWETLLDYEAQAK